MADEQGGAVADAARDAVATTWRAQSARIVAALAHLTRDVPLAEDLAQEAVAQALEQWPRDGIPENPAAWLTTVGRRRAIDLFRRGDALATRYELIAREPGFGTVSDPAALVDGGVDDDVLRLIFVACHPVLGREARIALTLRVVAGLQSEEIARAFVVPVATVQQRVVRAKKTLRAAKVPFETPSAGEFDTRLADVLEVIYLVFTEGYAATSGDTWVRADLAREAIRLGTLVARLVPRDAETHALVALMELQASRFEARVDAEGDAILLDDQDRSLWDAAAIARGLGSLDLADSLIDSRGRGPYALQAAIAACHARAQEPADTDWTEVVVLYDALLNLRPSPVVALNRAVAVSRSTGPATALRLVDAIARGGRLDDYAPLHAVQGDLLERLGHAAPAARAFRTAASLSVNERERAVLLRRAEELDPGGGAPPPSAIMPLNDTTSPHEKEEPR
ncbi:RNA polymerase sigma factor [Frondihabitans australicus]|uniref:RNA polymerase sigma factor n=1 Tax=Frondihabitans australicus TaxID=386892 RepID=A0A495IKR6_9MICO|nr:DUF6596 domain-containing protein [Frondihabitans australicus]RKR76592.1 RNA polymerase sigma factor (sigma-70 family) [Frondihabitans australicus]